MCRPKVCCVHKSVYQNAVFHLPWSCERAWTICFLNITCYLQSAASVTMIMKLGVGGWMALIHCAKVASFTCFSWLKWCYVCTWSAWEEVMSMLGLIPLDFLILLCIVYHSMRLERSCSFSPIVYSLQGYVVKFLNSFKWDHDVS